MKIGEEIKNEIAKYSSSKILSKKKKEKKNLKMYIKASMSI